VPPRLVPGCGKVAVFRIFDPAGRRSNRLIHLYFSACRAAVGREGVYPGGDTIRLAFALASAYASGRITGVNVGCDGLDRGFLGKP
jgi:hypothetical protein